MQSLSDVIAFNTAHAAVALKYGQILAQLSDSIDISPGSADTIQYTDARAQDIVKSRGALDFVYNGADGIQGTADDFDALLFSGNSGAGTPAKAGYPSITVPGGFVPPARADREPLPVGRDLLGPRVQRAAVDRARVRLRAGDQASPAAGQHAATAERHGATAVTRRRERGALGVAGRGGAREDSSFWWTSCSDAECVMAKQRSLTARKAAAGCRRCDLWKRGTQTVFGEGLLMRG